MGLCISHKINSDLGYARAYYSRLKHFKQFSDICSTKKILMHKPNYSEGLLIC